MNGVLILATISGGWGQASGHVRRTLWACLTFLERRLALSRWLSNGRNAILAYHAIGSPAQYGNVTAARFRRELEYLSDRFDVVDIPAVLNGPIDGSKRVAITIDDGYRSVYTTALPIVRDLGVPVTVFVPVGFVRGNRRDLVYRLTASPDGDPSFNRPRETRHDDRQSPEFMSEEQLMEIARDDLVQVGNHTLTHPDLETASDPDVIESEIRSGQAQLEELIGRTVDRFAYPYGRYDERALSVVRSLHDLAVTSREGLLDHGMDRYRLPRIDASVPAPRLRLTLADGTWALADQLR